MVKFFLGWGPVFIWAGLIFSLSSISTFPKVGFIWWDYVLKKSAHVLEYAVLYFLIVRALSIDNEVKFCLKNVTVKVLVIAFVVSALYAASDEYHQTFVQGRTGKITDVFFDVGGMLLSGFVIRKRRIRK